MVARLYPQALGSLFVASYDSQGYVEVFDPASTRDDCSSAGVLII
jgi:hypothetical protein